MSCMNAWESKVLRSTLGIVSLNIKTMTTKIRTFTNAWKSSITSNRLSQTARRSETHSQGQIIDLMSFSYQKQKYLTISSTKSQIMSTILMGPINFHFLISRNFYLEASLHSSLKNKEFQRIFGFWSLNGQILSNFSHKITILMNHSVCLCSGIPFS